MPTRHYLKQGPVSVEKWFSRYARTATASASSHELRGNFTSATGTGEYFVKSTADECIAVERVIIYVQDTGAIDLEQYGADISASGSAAAGFGIGMYVINSGSAATSAVLDLLDGVRVQTNGEWAGLCYDFNPYNFAAGDDGYTVRWTFGKAGSPIVIKNGQRIAVRLMGSFSGLTHHRFLFQGTRK